MSPKEDNYLPEEDSVDFAAAATAALGVPSPCLSRSLSCNDPEILVLGDHRIGRGDLEEEEQLMRALKLSRGEQSISIAHSVISDTNSSDATASSGENIILNNALSSNVVSETSTTQVVTSLESNKRELSVSETFYDTCCLEDNITSVPTAERGGESTSTTIASRPGDSEASEGILILNYSVELFMIC